MDISAIIIIPNSLVHGSASLHGFAKRPHSLLHLQSKKSPLAIAKSYARQTFQSCLRTISPAPPSKSTLSGTTMAAAPFVFSIVLICCTKLSCLFEVVVQKSCRYRSGPLYLACHHHCNGQNFSCRRGVRKNIIIGSWCGHRQRIISTNQNLTR